MVLEIVLVRWYKQINIVTNFDVVGQRFGILASKVALAFCLKDFVIEKAAVTSVPLQFEPRSLFMTNKSGLQLKAVRI